MNEITIYDIKVPTQREEAKAKNKDHQDKIHNEILDDITSCLKTSGELTANETAIAKTIIKAIAKGEVRNLKIIY